MRTFEIVFTSNEQNFNRYTKLGYYPIKDENEQNGQMLTSLNTRINYRKFVLAGDVTIDKVLSLGLLSGNIKKTSRLNRFIKSVGFYLREPDYFRKKDIYTKIIYFFMTNFDEKKSSQAIFGNIDLLNELLKSQDDPESQKIINEEYNKFIRYEAMKDANFVKIYEDASVGCIETNDFRDVIKAHSFVNVIVTLINEKILISVKDQETSLKLFGTEGLKSILPIISNLLRIELQGDEKIAHSSKNRKLTIKDCIRAAKYIVATM